MQIVLAIDGSKGARWAQDMVVALPLSPPLAMTVLTVLDLPQPRFTSLTPMGRQAYGDALATMRRETIEAAQEILSTAREALEGRSASVTTRVQEGPVAAAIIEAAEVWEADLVVVGARGLGPVKEFLLGSVSQKVARYAPCSVLIVKRPTIEVRRVLLATDGSVHAEAGMKFLSELSLPPEAAVHLCAVAETPVLLPLNAGMGRKERAAALQTIGEVETAAAERVLVKARTLLASRGWAVTTSLRAGHVSGQLLTAIRDFNPDVVILGAKGRIAAKRFVLGSVAQKVVKYAPCSVLVVRPKGLG